MSSVLRQAASAAKFSLRSQTRCLSTSPVTRKNLVQDLYVKELKAYKAPPAAKDAHVGNVKPFAAPSAPTAPSLPADLASELSSYDATEPVTEQKAAAALASTEDVGAGAEAYLAFLEADLPKAEVHH
ncbi:hypothetical protein JAAARDRAFT_210598 [Jaapia argillacea MUCL 33604]|uniref:ATP synthase subunit H, mitochondrial n=1 Tax=Jaapia argillacea MUCL 33604 TaxID=933084 RepID=A0A067PQ48_9AGAM|nr:hypothetical protein JAAARDRAFT_210598 [Jaapia argillacea MUCL 33604]